MLFESCINICDLATSMHWLFALLNVMMIISECFDDWLRQAALEAVVRGPKKKKGGAGGPEVVASEDVVNIWKDRTDPVRPTDISQSIEILFLS